MRPATKACEIVALSYCRVRLANLSLTHEIYEVFQAQNPQIDLIRSRFGIAFKSFFDVLNYIKKANERHFKRGQRSMAFLRLRVNLDNVNHIYDDDHHYPSIRRGLDVKYAKRVGQAHISRADADAGG